MELAQREIEAIRRLQHRQACRTGHLHASRCVDAAHQQRGSALQVRQVQVTPQGSCEARVLLFRELLSPLDLGQPSWFRWGAGGSASDATLIDLFLFDSDQPGFQRLTGAVAGSGATEPTDGERALRAPRGTGRRPAAGACRNSCAVITAALSSRRGRAQGQRTVHAQQYARRATTRPCPARRPSTPRHSAHR